ncbi:MAG: hypothetical protein LC772_02560 [Chloroflexi bacterium]|nr:hypothetical protein [Chloroflexota bacterium]
MSQLPTEQPLPLLNVCKHLRNKKMSYLSLSEALLPGTARDERTIGTGAPHWCFHTQGPVGPDGRRVSSVGCSQDRKCHCPL